MAIAQQSSQLGLAVPVLSPAVPEDIVVTEDHAGADNFAAASGKAASVCGSSADLAQQCVVKLTLPRIRADSIRASDAFVGGFVAAAWNGLPPDQQLMWGAAAADLVTTRTKDSSWMPDLKVDCNSSA